MSSEQRRRRQNIFQKNSLVVTTFDGYFRPKMLIKVGISRPIFIYFRRYYKQLTVNNCSIKVAGDWDSNTGPLVSEATALPTVPQSLPYQKSCEPLLVIVFFKRPATALLMVHHIRQTLFPDKKWMSWGRPEVLYTVVFSHLDGASEAVNFSCRLRHLKMSFNYPTSHRRAKG